MKVNTETGNPGKSPAHGNKGEGEGIGRKEGRKEENNDKYRKYNSKIRKLGMKERK